MSLQGELIHDLSEAVLPPSRQPLRPEIRRNEIQSAWICTWTRKPRWRLEGATWPLLCRCTAVLQNNRWFPVVVSSSRWPGSRGVSAGHISWRCWSWCEWWMRWSGTNIWGSREWFASGSRTWRQRRNALCICKLIFMTSYDLLCPFSCTSISCYVICLHSILFPCISAQSYPLLSSVLQKESQASQISTLLQKPVLQHAYGLIPKGVLDMVHDSLADGNRVRR